MGLSTWLSRQTQQLSKLVKALDWREMAEESAKVLIGQVEIRVQAEANQQIKAAADRFQEYGINPDVSRPILQSMAEDLIESAFARIERELDNINPEDNAPAPS